MRVKYDLYLVAALCIIASASALLSHVVCTSPAWKAEFSYIVELEEYDKETEPPNWGCLIDIGRALILIPFAYFAVTHLHLAEREQRRRSRRSYVIVFSLIAAAVLIANGIYCFRFAPDALAKMWNDHSLEELPWLAEEEGWSEEELTRPDPAEYRRMFMWPYVCFLPYSLVIYLGAMLPALYVSFRGSRSDYLALSDLFTNLSVQIQQTDDLEGLYHLIKDFDVAYLKIRSVLSRYTWLLAFIGLGAIYEVTIGHYTLAAVAALLGVFATLLLAVGLVFLVPDIMQWGALVSRFRIRIAEAKSQSEGGEKMDADAMAKNDKYVEELETKLFSRDSMGIAAKFVLGLVGALAAVARGIALLR